MAGRSSRKDLRRLQEIYSILLKPWDSDEDFLTPETKLWYTFSPEEFPIYRRRILMPMPVKGLWWMNESKWLRFLWHGHNGTVIKSGQDPDRVLATRSFRPKGWCYIRECKDHIDLEGTSDTTRWDFEKKKRIGCSISEWLTVSITKDTYKSLDKFLGPVNDFCRHEEEPYVALIK